MVNVGSRMKFQSTGLLAPVPPEIGGFSGPNKPLSKNKDMARCGRVTALTSSYQLSQGQTGIRKGQLSVATTLKISPFCGSWWLFLCICCQVQLTNAGTRESVASSLFSYRGNTAGSSLHVPCSQRFPVVSTLPLCLRMYHLIWWHSFLVQSLLNLTRSCSFL